MHVLIAAAGSGSRFGSELPKQHNQLAGKTVLEWTLELFLSANKFKSLNVIHAPNDTYIRNYKSKYPQVSFIAVGGGSRAESVLNGLNVLQTLNPPSDWVLVHDAARCCLDLVDLKNLIKQVESSPAAVSGGILATAATDTLKLSLNNSNLIAKTLDRRQIYLAQTPQMFRLADLIQALNSVDLEQVTDEASAMELAGKTVCLVETQHPNFKITYPHELKLAEFLLNKRLEESR
jgi:2-C-methyl-D-erythritol 4-phosphate cytidylyltransferase